MVSTRTGNFALGESSASGARAGASRPRGTAPAPPPPPPPLPPLSIEQLLATQNELIRVLTENLVQHEVCPSYHQSGVESSYTNFLVMHPPTFAEATDLLEVDNWLRIIESKFGLLHCTEF
jgi:hypothetical protein